ncbi:unnamed protein product [Staurois parvus]|uniref:Tc1-like transposase DDE domain-containing protein n=1 Tax=Staurois parvus TaxID=386267 RepID=A0ABN9AUR8_9NEOB|nr:unnamed protein product [Staurois parvus]
MVWAAISWYSAGPIITLKGRVTASDYVQILANHVHPMFQTLFPKDSAICQDNAPIHTVGVVKLQFDEHADEVSHLAWEPQLLDLNIIEPLWSNVGEQGLDPV